MFEYDTMTKEKVRKSDWILIMIILLAALILWSILHFWERPGDILIVSFEGEVLGQVSLDESEDRYYLIQYGNTELLEITDEQAQRYIQGQEPISADSYTDEEYNLFVCREDGMVQMLAASCPDQICVNHRAIEVSLENIICLPHKLVLEIVSGQEDTAKEADVKGLDGVTY